MPLATYLPPEIIALIVDEFQDQTQDTSPLLSIATSFHRPAKRHLFRSIYLGGSESEDWHTNIEARCRLLLDILDGDPQIFEYIKCLGIYFRRSAIWPPFGSTRDPSESTVTDLLRALSQHSNVITLELRSLLVTSNFYILPHSSVEPLIALRCQPSLRSLQIGSLNFVPWLLLTGIPSSDHLENLRLEYTELQTFATDLLFPFTVDALPPFLADPILHGEPHFPFPKLRTLYLHGGTVLERFSWYPCRRFGEETATQGSISTTWDPPSKDFTFPELECIVFDQGFSARQAQTIGKFIELSPRLQTVYVPAGTREKYIVYPTIPWPEHITVRPLEQMD